MKRSICTTMLLLAGTAQAESVEMYGIFPAENRALGQFHSVQIRQFGGTDGQALSLAIERSLGEPDGNQPPHFVLMAATRNGQSAPEAVVTGTVTTDVTQNRYTRNEKVCATKVDGKCTSKTDKVHHCTKRVIEFQIDIRVADNMTGAIPYSDSIGKRDNVSWCDNQQPARTVETTVRGMIEKAAAEFRLIAAPHAETYKVRFREDTKGLDKLSKAAFKSTIKKTQTDPAGACQDFATMNGQVPNHPSILFNLGLCAESVGDYAKAASFYAQAQPLMGDHDEANDGLERVGRLMAARSDAAKRSSS